MTKPITNTIPAIQSRVVRTAPSLLRTAGRMAPLFAASLGAGLAITASSMQGRNCAPIRSKAGK